MSKTYKDGKGAASGRSLGKSGRNDDPEEAIMKAQMAKQKKQKSGKTGGNSGRSIS